VTQPSATPVATIERRTDTPSTLAGYRSARWAGLPADRSRWAWRSDGLVAGIIIIFGLAFWVPAAVHADFMMDDFAMLEHFELPGIGFATYRPVAKLEMDIAHSFFGNQPTGYYVALAVMMALIGAAFYVALRHLGLAAVPAAIAGVGVVAYPRADSIGAWWADPAAPALLLGLLSVITGAIWVTSSGRSLRWFAPTLVLVALSVLCYESMAPMFLFALCLAPLSPNLRRTFICAIGSGLVALASALYIFSTEAGGHSAIGASQYVGHFRDLMTGGWQALVLHGLSSPTVVGFGFAVVTLLLIAVVLATRSDVLTVVEPWRRLLLALPLLVVGTALSLVPFVPSGSYYESTTPGTGNRVNGLAQIFALTFIVIIVWLLCRLIGSLAGGRNAMPITGATSFLVAVVLVSGYAGYVKQDQNYYNAASTRRAGYVNEIHRLRPVVETGDQVLLADYTSQMGPPGARWFSTIQDQWDASEIVALTYDHSNMVAEPLVADSECLPSSVSIQVPAGFDKVPYGKVVVIDLGRERVEGLADQAQCEAELASLVTTSGPGLPAGN
jgi:hypothetical protein